MNEPEQRTRIEAFVGILRGLFCLAYTLLWTALGLASVPFSPSGRLYYIFARIWGATMLKAAGVTYRVQGLENLEPGATYLVMANHQSLSDIPLLFAALRIPIRFMAKKSLSYIPIFGWSLWAARFVFIDRFNAREAHKGIGRAIAEIRKGPSLAVFPEGTRSLDGTLGEMKKGGFILAVDAKVPVVPVGIAGTCKVMARTGIKVFSRTVALAVGAPIPTAQLQRDDRHALLRQVEREIADLIEQAKALLQDQPV